MVTNVKKYSATRTPCLLVIKYEEDCEYNDAELPNIGYCFNYGRNNHCKNDCTFLFLCSDANNQSIDISLLGKSEYNHYAEKSDSKIISLEAEIKRLIDENKYHQKFLQLFDERDCTYKE